MVMMRILVIAAGGAIGAVLRYAVSGFAQRWGGSFPLGTLVVNTGGCLLAGTMVAVFAGPHAIREEYRMGLLIGMLGAFTTYSAFSWETVSLASGGQTRLAVLNVILNNAMGLTAAWIGYRTAVRWFAG